VHHFLMPSKTISLEVDAYKRLRATRRDGESFSAVVRRITLPPAKATAADLLKEMKASTFGRGANWIAIKRAVAGRKRSRDLRVT
jgi:predicted CopG family antitoxin